jgi:hypothetical protein
MPSFRVKCGRASAWLPTELCFRRYSRVDLLPYRSIYQKWLFMHKNNAAFYADGTTKSDRSEAAVVRSPTAAKLPWYEVRPQRSCRSTKSDRSEAAVVRSPTAAKLPWYEVRPQRSCRGTKSDCSEAAVVRSPTAAKLPWYEVRPQRSCRGTKSDRIK